MRIRPYEPGDEEAQARVFNAAAGALPAFKPATAGEIARRYGTVDPDPASRLYAVDDATGAVVGYALFHPNGRVSYPWCLPGAEEARGPLLDALSAEMAGRGFVEAWAAYRADWSPVLEFLRGRGFVPARAMVNFVAATDDLPSAPVPDGLALGPLGRDDLPRLLELGRGLFADDDPDRLGDALRGNPFFGPDSLVTLRDRGAVVGAAVAIASTGYADPTKLDAAMPCFRLGAFGTERERHKRVNGMVSCVFADESAGEVLLAEAARRFRAAGLPHAASQAPSDRPDLVAFYQRFFRPQGSFPILSRRLA
ncbi:MAG: hypothetical protein LC745_02150 [Planctomycetia bacterium]|nr:hypothetical protein [Planctomycetia bacterium]